MRARATPAPVLASTPKLLLLRRRRRRAGRNAAPAAAAASRPPAPAAAPPLNRVCLRRHQLEQLSSEDSGWKGLGRR